MPLFTELPRSRVKEARTEFLLALEVAYRGKEA